MAYNPTTIKPLEQIQAAINALDNPGERDFLNAVLNGTILILFGAIHPKIATLPGNKGFAAGTFGAFLTNMRHMASNYEKPMGGKLSLLYQLRDASVRGNPDLAPGNRQRLLNTHTGNFSDPAHDILLDLIARASVDAADKARVKHPLP
jgi:hypothetical protein